MSAKAYGLQEIKKELQHLNPKQLTDLCLRMARYKKENKELLAYLLFNAADNDVFIQQVKDETENMFRELPGFSYQAGKVLRKILRLNNKYIKFMALKPAEVEVILNYCRLYIDYVDHRTNYKPIRQILIKQLERIMKVIQKLDEDLQFDYTQEFNELLNNADNRLSWFNQNNYRL